jgi:hypothetical protein
MQASARHWAQTPPFQKNTLLQQLQLWRTILLEFDVPACHDHDARKPGNSGPDASRRQAQPPYFTSFFIVARVVAALQGRHERCCWRALDSVLFSANKGRDDPRRRRLLGKMGTIKASHRSIPVSPCKRSRLNRYMISLSRGIIRSQTFDIRIIASQVSLWSINQQSYIVPPISKTTGLLTQHHLTVDRV